MQTQNAPISRADGSVDELNVSTAVPPAWVQKQQQDRHFLLPLDTLRTPVTLWQHRVPNSLWQEWLGLNDASLFHGPCIVHLVHLTCFSELGPWRHFIFSSSALIFFF